MGDPVASDAALVLEEQEACDIDDPFAMMGGMGEEEIYKVTLMDEKGGARDEEKEATKQDEEESGTSEAADATCAFGASSGSNSLANRQLDGSEVKRKLATCNSGLDNLGNTCFLNSSVTCLANVPALRDYFLNGLYKKHVRVNGLLTPLTQGRFADGFHELLSKMWSPRIGEGGSFRPTRFKDLIAKTDDRFVGNRQHDSMEFIEFLVDSLKEDCNKVKGQKIYHEREDDDGRPVQEVALAAAYYYTLRNDSFIDDLFTGFFKNVTICPEASCRHESVVFDPYLSVKLDLHSNSSPDARMFAVTVVPLEHGRPTRHKLSLDGHESCAHLVEEVAKTASLVVSKCVLVEVNRGRVVCFFEDGDRLEHIGSDRHLVLYEVADVLVFKEVQQRMSNGDEIIVLEDLRSDNKKPVELSRGMIGKIEKVDKDGDALVSFPDFDKRQWIYKTHFDRVVNTSSGDERVCAKDSEAYTLAQVQEWDEFKDDTLALLECWEKGMQPSRKAAQQCGCIVHFRRERPGTGVDLLGLPLLLCTPCDATAAAIHETIGAQLESRFGTEGSKVGWTLYKAPHDDGGLRTTCDLVVGSEGYTSEADQLQLSERAYFVVHWGSDVPDEVLKILQDSGEVRPQDSCITINKCFEFLTEPEQLTDDCTVYCSGCKQQRPVVKRLELWSLPPVLVIHLKRFEIANYGRRRLDTPVSFPLEGLDLRPFCGYRESFPAGQCLRAEQLVQIHGLTSEKGKEMNSLTGIAMYLDAKTQRFCVRIQEGDPVEAWKRIKPENLRPVPHEHKSEVQKSADNVFDLIGISKHLGASTYGHYLSYARSDEDGSWRLYDDDDVKKVPDEKVASELKGAYVLFYLRRDMRPLSWGPPTKDDE